MEHATLNLTKQSSDMPELSEAIPEPDSAPAGLINLQKVSLGSKNFQVRSSVTKTLGLRWVTKKDTLTLIIELNQWQGGTYTKREVASCATKVFDTVGLITPPLLREHVQL